MAQGIANRFSHSGVEKIGNQQTTSTALVNATGLGFVIDPLEKISFRFMVVFEATSALQSIKLDVNAPVGPTVLAYDISIPDSLTSVVRGINQAATGTLLPSANTPFIAWAWGHIENGDNAGSVRIQFASTSGLSTATIHDNSSVVIWDINP